ncbi:glycosyltransferase [Nitrospira sp. Nam80]
MHIALINSPSLATRPVSRSMAGGLGFDGSGQMLLPPLDLAIMAASLRQADHHVEVIDADPLGLDQAGVLTKLQGAQWDVIIASVSLPTLDQDAAFLVALRLGCPGARIFGKTLVRDHEVLQALLAKSGADLVIHGEADLSIVDLVAGRTRSGTAWLDMEEGRPRFRSDEGEAVRDLNALPFPARDLLPNDRYCYPLLGSPVATIQTSRGCPYPCGFYCPYPLVEGVKWRAMSAERIAAELRDIVERHHLSKIYFRDATFTLNQERIIALCDLIMAAGWRLEWVCETRVDCLGDTVLDKMRAAGCVGILIGVESGDEQTMHHREGKKGLTIPKLSHLRDKTRQLGIRLHFLLIVGLPQDTRESVVDTYELIHRYEPDTIGVTIITPYPGTPLYEQGVREGWIDSFHWKDYGGHQVPMHTPHLSRDEMIAGKRFLEEGFAILSRAKRPGGSQDHRTQHYERLLRWAYRLEQPMAQMQALVQHRKALEARRHPPVEFATSSDLSAGGPATCVLSVVIPTYNRRAILRKTLLAFASQTLAHDQFEVIVVDDGSSDDTVDMVRRFKSSFALRLEPQPHQGANAARNRGIHAARGGVIIISGDDMVPEPRFLEAHLAFHRQHPAETDAMLGFIDWSPEISVTPFMRYLVSPEGGQQFAFHEVKNGKADFRLFYTSNVSLKRGLLLRQPVLFDTDFTYPAYDDTELGYRLAKQGMQLHYNALAVTCHHHEMTVEGFIERQRKAGHMAVLLARKHPALDRLLLGIEELLQSGQRCTDEMVRCLLNGLRELEKPNLESLAQLRIHQTTLDHWYTKSVLYPLYGLILTKAYHLGVWEASASSRGRRPAPMTAVSRPAMRFSVSIIIPVFNKVELTIQCLSRLAQVTRGVEYEVIVVDNHSTDGTPDFLAGLGGDVQVISNRDNLGFAKACNQGALAARGQYLLFLNNDTIPLTDWLMPLIEEVEQNSRTAVVGSKLLYEDGTIQHAGVAFSRVWFTPYHVYSGQPADAPCVNRRREFQSITAACMLVRREIFESVGGFDEGYRNGFEDVDLCLKIRQQGWEVIYRPDSVLYHLESQTPGRKAHDKDNAKRLVQRWAHQWNLTDEDAIYHADGYALRYYNDDGVLRSRVEQLSDPAAQSQWNTVATVQRASQQDDMETVLAWLVRPDQWPADVWALRWAAFVCRCVGRHGLAEPFWERVLQMEEDPDARVALAKSALERGELGTSDEHLKQLFMKHPDHGEGLLVRGILAMQREAYAEAGNAFGQALCHHADARKARLGIAMSALGLKQPIRAWSSLIAVLADHPDDAEAMHWLVRAGTLLSRWEELGDRLMTYVTRNPADLGARFALCGVLVRVNRMDRARQECDRLRLLDESYDGLKELEQRIAAKQSVIVSDHAA